LAEAQVSRFALVSDMASSVVHDIMGAAVALSKRQFLDYDPSYQTSTSQVLVENLSEIPELARMRKMLHAPARRLPLRQRPVEWCSSDR
jgi:hypothetical protein